jgi:hypothetical protein
LLLLGVDTTCVALGIATLRRASSATDHVSTPRARD